MKIYQYIFEYTPDALFVVDQAGHITLVNAVAENLFGYARAELLGQLIEVLIPPRLAAHHVRHRASFMHETRSRAMGTTVSLFARRKHGDEFPVDVMLSPMIVDGQQLTLCVVRDISERRAAEDKLKHQTAELEQLHAALLEVANHDSLTGLYNRRAFRELGGQLFKTAYRNDASVSVLMLDLDHFKGINDRFGHAEGDRVLQAVAATLKATARDNDIVTRYGGEEFVVAMLGADAAESQATAERLRLAIAAICGLKIPITASIGVASCRPALHPRGDETHSLEVLLDQADQALYAAKNRGRNQVCHHAELGQPQCAPRQLATQ
jgi:diguanylate cyclase (GGDEF)-like protein/PAS domain S-box-containing protein